MSYFDVLTKWNAENPMSQFTGPIAEALWNSSMECGHDEDTGDVESFGWYALFTFSDSQESERFHCSPSAVGSILCQVSDGSISADVFNNKAALTDAWNAIERAYEEVCEDGEELEEE